MQKPRFGLGFRTQHAGEIAREPGPVDWFEVLSDHYIGVGGKRRALLERLRAARPVALHGVSLSIAGSEPLDREYVDGLAALAAWVEPVFVSDHLCWTALGGHASHDLLPVACTRALLDHVAGRVAEVQDRLGRRLLLENASAYVAFRAREMDEMDFLAELARRTGCGVLLDVNNLVVNAANLGSDPQRAFAVLPEAAVGYLHLAGHAVLSDVRIDTHDATVPAAVWGLFEEAARRFPAASVILERDDDIPPYAELVSEVEEARARHAAARGRRRPPPRAAPERARREGEAAERAPWPELPRALFSRVVDQPVGFEQGDLDGLLDASLPVRAARGLRVYSDAYAVSLRRALATNFAALARVLSPRDFARLAAGYLRAHPPRGFDCVRLGHALADFVAGFDLADDYGVAHAALADLARLEQAQLEVQDAPDARGAVTPDDLARLAPEDWERVRIRFSPALRIVRATHDVGPVIEAVGRGEDPARPMPGPVAYLVTRLGDGVRAERLAPAEADALDALGAGATFLAACAGEAALATELARRVVEAAAAGALSALEIPSQG